MSRRRFAPVHTVALNVTYRGRKISVSPSWEFPGFWQASTPTQDGKMYSFFARSALAAFCGLRDYEYEEAEKWLKIVSAAGSPGPVRK